MDILKRIFCFGCPRKIFDEEQASENCSTKAIISPRQFIFLDSSLPDLPASSETLTDFRESSIASQECHVHPHREHYHSIPQNTTQTIKVLTPQCEEFHLDETIRFLKDKGIQINDREKLRVALRPGVNYRLAVIGDKAQGLTLADEWNKDTTKNSDFFAKKVSANVGTNNYQNFMATKHELTQFMYTVPEDRYVRIDQKLNVRRRSICWKARADMLEAIMGVIRQDGPDWEARLTEFMKVFELDYEASLRNPKGTFDLRGAGKVKNVVERKSQIARKEKNIGQGQMKTKSVGGSKRNSQDREQTRFQIMRIGTGGSNGCFKTKSKGKGKAVTVLQSKAKNTSRSCESCNAVKEVYPVTDLNDTTTS